MTQINFISRLWIQKTALIACLLFVSSSSLFAQSGGWKNHNHHWNDTLPPPPPPPPGNDSLPPPPPPPPHWGDSTRNHHPGNDSLPWDSIGRHHWNDSIPLDTIHCHRPGNDSIPGDSIRHRHLWNDSLPCRHFWNDSIPGFDTIHCHHWNDSIPRDSTSLDKMRLGTKVSIYPNPIATSATVHISSSTGILQLNLFDRSGRLMLALPNLVNGDVQLNRDGLQSGIYFYELRSNNIMVSSGTVVIQ